MTLKKTESQINAAARISRAVSDLFACYLTPSQRKSIEKDIFALSKSVDDRENLLLIQVILASALASVTDENLKPDVSSIH